MKPRDEELEKLLGETEEEKRATRLLLGSEVEVQDGQIRRRGERVGPLAEAIRNIKKRTLATKEELEELLEQVRAELQLSQEEYEEWRKFYLRRFE